MTAKSNSAPRILSLHLNNAGPLIDRDIFGQFAEMLGSGVYGGLWVGPHSDIPNVRGIRSDVVRALKDLQIPNVRWPGGCFADRYHWRDGIGPYEQRRARVNMWGNCLEPNTFGVHEFMDFVEQIGSEAYINVNVGSGAVQEAADWLEYMTAAHPTALAKERIANGRTAPWRVKYLGIGNEPWGCGGSFRPDAYIDVMKLFATYVQNLHPDQINPPFGRNPNAMKRIAAAQEHGKTAYTEAIMKAWSERIPYFWNIEGLSLHHYSHIGELPFEDDSVEFGEEEFTKLLAKTSAMNEMLAEHSAIMDRYDPEKQVALVIDEWGAWLKPLPGADFFSLRQQNTLRDAILAALHLNIFARHADRVRMANIAQMVNVLQAMILTEGAKIVLTPTYYVFRMYIPFQDAEFIPVTYEPGRLRDIQDALPQIDAIAARANDGAIAVAIINCDPDNAIPVKIVGVDLQRATGSVLTGPRVNAYNDVAAEFTVAPDAIELDCADGVSFEVPARAVAVLRLEQSM